MTSLLVLMALIIALLCAIPWRRESPRHRFALDQLRRLGDLQNSRTVVDKPVVEFPRAA